MNRYIIIGAGIAGLSAAKAIRENDNTGKIDIFTAENNLPYSRPMLTKNPFISFDPDRWTIYPQQWFDENRIDIMPGVKINAIDVAQKVVQTTDSVYKYDKLILATGAQNFIPPVKGADGSKIFTIRRSQDIFNIKKEYKADTNIVIVGGGVIGLEAAVELARYGARVTVIETMPYLMSKQIDEEISDLICRKLDAIDIKTNAEVSEIADSKSGKVVLLSDGTELPCDFVLMACGIRAETSIVPAEVSCAKSIIINRYCQTSAPDIYAAGDCAQYNEINYALWSQAMVQGEIAGRNAVLQTSPNCDLESMQELGAVLALESSQDSASVHDLESAHIDTSLVMNSPELSLFALGDLGKDPQRDYEIKYFTSKDVPNSFYVNPTQGEFFEKQYWLDGKMVGAAIVGNLSRMDCLKNAISGMEVQDDEN